MDHPKVPPDHVPSAIMPQLIPNMGDLGRCCSLHVGLRFDVSYLIRVSDEGPVQKFFSILMVVGLAGCSGAPIMSMGLSAEPDISDSAPEVPAEQVPKSSRVISSRPVKPIAAKAPQREKDDPNEDLADRAARVNDREVQRLERAAQSATSSICRGC